MGLRHLASLGLSHLGEHKYKHSFQDFLEPICTCEYETEITTHYLIQCFIFANERMTVLNKIRNINTSIFVLFWTGNTLLGRVSNKNSQLSV